MTKRAAIILAGGKATRFQTAQGTWQDKALAEIDGKPLLVHAIENMHGVVDEIIVVVNENKTRISQYHDVLQKFHDEKARIVTDLKCNNLSGPLVAILTGLRFVNADYCITVPCDMPMLSKEVAEYFFHQINGSFVSIPMWPNGRLETLLMVLERKSMLEIAELLCELGRSHPDDIIRGSSKTFFASPLGEIKALDPELCSFVNINSQEDLSRLQPRQGQGSDPENIRLDLGALPVEEIQRLIYASLKRESSDFSEASNTFSVSADTLERIKLFFWAGMSREFEAKSLLNLFEQCPKQILVGEVKDAFLKAARNY
ncbi:MAG TPA: molybdenum cofactor guanylyltransferase, partial [Candidatus Binatia bacterium]|nr:molybdenum cofactor guanylyltransferase [Candidatus Binatia bacterium]